jgi:hypothetical protein
MADNLFIEHRSSILHSWKLKLVEKLEEKKIIEGLQVHGLKHIPKAASHCIFLQ